MVWDRDVRKPGGSKIKYSFKYIYIYIYIYNKEALAYVRLWTWWVPIVILSK